MINTLDKSRSWEDVKKELKNLIDIDERSITAIIKEAGLSRDTYYKLDDPAKFESPMRKTSVKRLAKVLNVPCDYNNEIPYLNEVHINSPTLSGVTPKDIIKYAIGTVGKVPVLAEAIDVSETEIMRIAASDNEDKVISFTLLKKIVQTIGKELVIVGDNSLALLDGKEEISKIDSPILKTPTSKIGVTDNFSISGISDRGLLELLSPDNLVKHDISDQELEELSSLQRSRKSHGTISQWINILYSIRALAST